ncbi:transglycosylase domain-containing protein [Streptomyces sp. NPDC086766]|uniref:transglycosylase domain-containing protein n=1 Tax=Streptomyces sp. NPDC086766 TaxID=3365754 RepID=UPI0038202CAE
MSDEPQPQQPAQPQQPQEPAEGRDAEEPPAAPAAEGAAAAAEGGPDAAEGRPPTPDPGTASAKSGPGVEESGEAAIESGTPTADRGTDAPDRGTDAPARETDAPARETNRETDATTARGTDATEVIPRAVHGEAAAAEAGPRRAKSETATAKSEAAAAESGTTVAESGTARRPGRTGLRRLLPTWRMVFGGFILAVLLLICGFLLGYSLVEIPPANALALKQSNVYLYADGTEIARDGVVNRENVGLAQISKEAQHAVLAAEDRDFYTESAVDPQAMLRAGWNTVTGKGRQSGSTITQQYVKNYYLGQEQTVTRKVKEFFIAIKLDRTETKDEILRGYLNTSYFGRNAYGIQAAAQAYYGMKAADLDPARAAYLAALVNAPSEYDVVAHPENKGAAVARWNYVLDGMVKQGWLARSERAGLTFPMPKESSVSAGMSGQRGYLVRIIRDYLTSNKILDDEQLAAGGYRITTTLEKSKQDAFVKAVDDQLMARLDPKNRKVDSYVRAGGAAIDPKTGKVVAMYNGIDYVKQYTPNATRRDFQVGSTFKPFVFASAVQNHSETQDGRVINPNTVYDGTNERPVEGWNGSYAPENEDGRSYGDITAREATDKSVNSVYAQMAVDVGPDKVKETAIALGLPATTPDLTATPSIALGPATASVLDMAQAYATLANHGERGTYTMVQKVTKGGAEVVELPQRTTSQAVSREAADTTTAVLQSVVQNGTGTPAQAVGRPAAGKTGTAEEDTAAWFAGYTPDLATVVSVMGQDPVTAAHKPLYGAMGLPRINGSGAPTEIWSQFTRDALKDTPATDFDLQLQNGADETLPPTDPWQTPGTGGQGDGGTWPPTGGQDTQGQDAGATQGQTGTPTDGTTGATPTTGGTTGGTPTDGTNGGTTGGGATGGTTGDTTGGTTGPTPTTGGTTGDTTGTTDGTNGDGGTTTGTGGTPAAWQP